MRPELFSIGPVTVYSYGLMIAIGVLAAILVAERRARSLGLDPEKVFGLGIWCALIGILGAKLMFILTELPTILKNPGMLLNISDGFVVYGGIIAGILFAIWYCKRKKMDFMAYFDLVMPSIALAQGFGRIGCFMAGCCYGKETSAWYGVSFGNSPFAPHDVHVIPTQLLSSAGDFLIFAILVFYAKRAKRKGAVAALYLILYSVGRFLIEFLRDDPRGTVGIFSTSQFISLFMLAAGILIMTFVHKKKAA